jgi:hypothetical protein
VADVAAETLLFALLAGIGGLLAARPDRLALLTTAVSFGVLVFCERLGWHYLLSDGWPAAACPTGAGWPTGYK